MISRALGCVAGGLLLAGCARIPTPAPPPVRFVVAVPDGLALTSVAVSPNGQWLAYAAEATGDRQRRIFVRALRDAPEQARELTATIGGANPFFSPDGASVAYFAEGALWRVPTAGDTRPVKVVDAPVESAGGTWTEADRIVYAPLGGRGLMEVPASGGTPASLTVPNPRGGELEHGWPHAMPGGAMVFTVSQRDRDPHVEVLSATGERRRLRVPIFGPAQFVDTGHLVYGYLGNLMAVRFDIQKLEIHRAPAALAKGLQTGEWGGALGRTGFAVSRNGTLAWLRATPEDARSRLVRVARDGSYEPLPAPAEVYQTPRLSPDGRRLAVVVRPGFMTREVRVLDAARPERVLSTIVGGDNQSPAWMDNQRLTFASNRDGLLKIFVVSVGGTPTPLFTVEVAAARTPAGWVRSARLLAFSEVDPLRKRDVMLYRVGESVVPVAATNANERSPALSPDGKWVAYVSDASGRDEIYMKPLDGSMDTLQLTSSGAVEPVWTREGLFYRSGDRVMLVALDSGAPGALREIFRGHFERDPGAHLAAYDVDGRGRFIMLKSALAPRELRVVQHWGSELAQVGR